MLKSKTTILTLAVALFLFAIQPTLCVNPTQNYVKIFLSPFYRPSMTQNTNYTYTVNVNPPDKVSSVKSAIITFEVYISPTVTFFGYVNGKPCNTPNYTISTTYASAGLGKINFDCSNIINNEGNYTFTLRPTSQNTGASTGWIDLVYMNDPSGSLSIQGTEYTEGQQGTLFLQLQDSQGNAVQNATCYLDVYYPPLSNQTHPIWINKGVMLYKDNSQGLYYYDFITPYRVGVYMATAMCYYYTEDTHYYPPYSPDSPNRTIYAGTFVGDTYVLNDYADWLYTQCRGDKICNSTYEWVVGNNITEINLLYLGESSIASTMNFYAWNWENSSWVRLPNTLNFHATALTSGTPSGVDEYVSNPFPNNVTPYISTQNKARVMLYDIGGSTHYIYDNWVNLQAVKTTDFVTSLRGTGEIHISSSTGENFIITNGNLDCEDGNSGNCALFTNDGEFEFTEGELEDNVTVNSMVSNVVALWSYSTPFTVDCTALYWVKIYNESTDTWDLTEDYMLSSDASNENCVLTFILNAEYGNTYEYWIKMDNFMKWEVDYSWQLINAMNDSLSPVCLELGGNYSYETPIIESTNVSEDNNIRYCHRFFDDMYWVEQYYNDSLDIGIAGDYIGFVHELRFYRESMYNHYLYLEENNITLPENITSNIVGNFTGNIVGNITGTVSSIDSDKLEYAGGTEYLSGTEGQIIYQYITVSAGNQIPVNDADWCNATIYYPNNTKFINNQAMPYLSGTNGLYWSNFTVPNMDGVYKTEAVCYKSPKYTYSSATFHVENTLANNQQTIYTFVQGMNTTMSSFQELIKPQIQNISDYVQELIDRIYGTAIS